MQYTTRWPTRCAPQNGICRHADVGMATVRVHAVEAGLATLEVTDVQGRVVLRQDLSLAAGVQALTLDVDALEGGAYNVELRQGTTPLGTSRLVVLD